LTEGFTLKKTSGRGQVKSVVDILGKRIAAGQYKEGETLPIEQELADSLGVGRNTLREAVKVLTGKGLITTAPRSGTKIRSKDEWNMLDADVLSWHADPETATPEFLLALLEIRRIIEPKAAELAAVRATREDVAAILSAYDDMQRCQDDPEQRLTADIELHTAILVASHNTYISHFRYAIATYLKAHSKIGWETGQDKVQLDLELHHDIAWSIARGKAKSAYSNTVKMLNHGRLRVEEAAHSLAEEAEHH
jgi:DNA-binding FadR family transcriptional regulator